MTKRPARKTPDTPVNSGIIMDQDDSSRATGCDFRGGLIRSCHGNSAAVNSETDDDPQEPFRTGRRFDDRRHLQQHGGGDDRRWQQCGSDRVTANAACPPSPTERGRSASSDRPPPFLKDAMMSEVFILVCDPHPRLLPKPKRCAPHCAGLFGLRIPIERPALRDIPESGRKR